MNKSITLIVLILIVSTLFNCNNNYELNSNDSKKDKKFLDKASQELLEYIKENSMNYESLSYIDDNFVPTILELKNRDPKIFDQISILILLKVYHENINDGDMQGIRIHKESKEFSFLILLYSGFLNISNDYDVDSGINNVFYWSKLNKEQIQINESLIYLDLIDKEMKKFDSTIEEIKKNSSQ